MPNSDVRMKRQTVATCAPAERLWRTATKPFTLTPSSIGRVMKPSLVRTNTEGLSSTGWIDFWGTVTLAG